MADEGLESVLRRDFWTRELMIDLCNRLDLPGVMQPAARTDEAFLEENCRWLMKKSNRDPVFRGELRRELGVPDPEQVQMRAAVRSADASEEANETAHAALQRARWANWIAFASFVVAVASFIAATWRR